MKLEVIIERSSDGLFAAYAEEMIGKHGLAGYGDSVAEALEDFQVSVGEMNDMRKDEGLPPVEVEVIPKYDIESFFDRFPYLNVSRVADIAGINPSLMRQYASGVTKAGEKQYVKIRNAVTSIARELSLATF